MNYWLGEMSQYSRKENFLIANTLNCIPVLLNGHAVIIDLRNETTIVGRIENSDGYMNIYLTEAIFVDRLGKQYLFDNFMVRERMIRQIHLPSHIDVNAKVRSRCDGGFFNIKHSKVAKTKRTFKQKRAQEKHKQTLNEISEQRKLDIGNLSHK